jgi:hypothetical protein
LFLLQRRRLHAGFTNGIPGRCRSSRHP